MIVAAVRELPNAQKILARVPPESLAALEDCYGSSWVPARPYDDVAEALLAEVGQAGICRFFEGQATSWSESKLLGPIFKAGQRIFGLTPAGQLKWLGHGWRVTTRGMGELCTREWEDGLEVEVTGLPPSHRIPRMVASTEGSIRGLVLGYDAIPLIETDSSELAQGRIVYRVRWTMD